MLTRTRIRTRKFTSLLIAIAIVGSNLPSFNTIAVASEVTNLTIDNPITSVVSSDNTLQMSFEDNYQDESTNHLTATPQGNPTFIPGRIGKGLQINTTTSVKQYVNLGKPSSLQFGTDTNFSLSLWLKSNSVSGDPAILSNKNWDSGKNTGYVLGLNGNNLRWNYNTAEGSRVDADIPNVVDGSWHHVVVSHDRVTGRVDFYKDGSPVAVSKVNGSNFAGITSTMTIAAQKGTIDAGLSTIIGNDGTGNYALPLNVQLDELTILRRAITPQEVIDIYNSAPPIQLNENFNGSLNLIGAQHTVQGSQFRYNLDLRTPTMNARIDKAIVEIGYDAQAFDFVSASRATVIDNTTPGIVRLELPGGFVYNQTNPLEYSKSRLSELKFNTKASMGQGTIQVNMAEFYNGTTKFKNESLNMQPQTIQIHSKASEDLNKDGHVTIGDVALAQGNADEILKSIAGAVKYQPYKRVVVIGIDGGGVSVNKDAPYWENTSSIKDKVGDRLQVTAIRNIIENGAVSYTAKTTLPSSSSPNWGAMLNGVGFEKHGLNNDHTAAYTYSENSLYPSIFKKLKEALPATKLAAFTTWSNIVQGHIEPSVGVEGLSLGDDADVAAFEKYAASGKAYDSSLIFFQLDDMDGAGHNTGFYTKTYYEQLKKTDKNVQSIYNTLKNNNLLDDTLILMLPDHGGGTEGPLGTLTNATSHGQDSPLATTIFFAANGRTVATDVGKEKILKGGNTKDLSATILAGLGIDSTIGDSKVIDGMFVPQIDQNKANTSNLQLTKVTDMLTQQVKGYEISVNQLTTDAKAIDIKLTHGDLAFTAIEPAQAGTKILRNETLNGTTRIVVSSASVIQPDAPILRLRVASQGLNTFAQVNQAMIADSTGKEILPNLTKTTKVESTNMTLLDLQVNGQTLNGFVPDKFNYTVTVPNIVSVTQVTYTAADPLTSVKVTGGEHLIVGDNHVEITVSAQDGTSNVYSIRVIREPEAATSEAKLLDLRVNGQTVHGFTPNNLNYQMSVPNSISVTEVTYSASDPLADVTIIGGNKLVVGDNLVSVTVTTQDGTQMVYTIIITRQRLESPTTDNGNNSFIEITPPKVNVVNNTQTQLPPKGAIFIPDESLKDKSNTKISVPLPTDKSKVLIPLSQVDIMADRDLEIVSEKVHVLIPAQVLLSLKKLLPSTSKTGTITLNLSAVAASSANLAMQSVNNTTDHANYSLVGNLMDISLFMTDDAGQVHKLGTFPTPIKVTFPLSKDANRNALGIYRIEPNGSLVYIGGALIQEGAFIEVQLNHFSQYAVLTLDKSYTDVSPEHWAYKTIQFLSAKQIVKGLTESTFGPSANVTRAEYTTLLVRALGLKSTSQPSSFADVVQGSWYAEAVSAAHSAGIVTGTSAHQFNPNHNITREEMAAMLVRAYEYRNGVTLNASGDVLLSDASKLSPWATKYVHAAITAKLLAGQKDGEFKPQLLTTRAESAQAIYNLIINR